MSDADSDIDVADGGPALAGEPTSAELDLKPGLQVPLEGRQEELPLVETLTADEAARAVFARK